MDASLSSERGIAVSSLNTNEQNYDYITSIMKAHINGYPVQYRDLRSSDNDWYDVVTLPTSFSGKWRIKPLTPAEKLLAMRNKSRELIKELKTSLGWSDEQITELLNRE